MPQTSGPISQGTTAERQFSDVLWRDLFGDEPGIIGDYDGTAYSLTRPTTGDIVTVGSTTQQSTAIVAGFVHKIAAGSTETITIPAASGSARTDIISARYDPSYTGSPGPVRLFRIAGSGASIPTYDASPPGVEDLPLWAITRSPGQNLSQATLVKMAPRIAPHLEVASGVALPTSSPLGTTLRQGTTNYHRTLSTGGVAVWTAETTPAIVTGIKQGKVSSSLSNANSRTGTVTFPTPFASAPGSVQLSVEVPSTSNIDLVAVMTGSPSASQFSWRVRERGGSAQSVNFVLHWTAFPSGLA